MHRRLRPAGAPVLNDDLAMELGLAILESTRLGDPADPQAVRADGSRSVSARRASRACGRLVGSLELRPGPGAGLMVRKGAAPGLEIVDARPGSAAAKAGLAKGDQIVAIGGKAIADLAPDAMMKSLRTSPLHLTVRRGSTDREVDLVF